MKTGRKEGRMEGGRKSIKSIIFMKSIKSIKLTMCIKSMKAMKQFNEGHQDENLLSPKFEKVRKSNLTITSNYEC